MSTKFLSPGWRMPTDANQSKSSNYSLKGTNPNVRINISSPAEVGITSSFSFWLKRTNNTVVTQPYRVVGSGLYGFYMAGTSDIYVRYGAGAETFNSTNTQNALALTDWVHWVITRQEVTSTTQDVKLYANGNLVDSVNGTTLLGTLDSKVDSLMYQIQATDFMNSFAIFDYALSQGQVTTLYGDSTSGPGNPMALPSTPIAYYPLGTSAYNGEYLAENNAIGDYVFDFDSASSDTVSVVSPPTLTGDSCLSVWIKASTNPAVAGILSSKNYSNNANSFSLQNRSGNIYFALYDSGSTYKIGNFTPSTALIDNWNHIAVVIDTVATDARIYFNKSLALTVDLSASSVDISDIVNGFSISGYSTNSSLPAVLNFFDGEISNAQIFNTALSSTEIETLYNYGSPIKTLASIPKSSNLKAWYKLDASEVYNSTSTEWEINEATSPWTSSLSFDSANNDKVDCGTISQTNEGDISFSVWCNLTTTGGYFSVLSSTDSASRAGINIIIANNGKIKFERNQNISGTRNNSGYNVDFSFGSWNHLCGTFDSASGVLKAYVNGVLQNTSNNTTNSASVAGNLTIGALVDNTGYSANGSISNVQIFNTALPATGSNSVEILYNNGSPLTDMSSFTSLLNWYKLDNLTTGIEDSKGSNNGTNNGATEIYGAVSTLNGTSSGMSQANLIQSDLQTVAPYSKYAMNFDGADDYIDCGSFTALNSGTAMTVSLWFKGSTYITNARLIRCAQFEIYQGQAAYSNTQGRLTYRARGNYGNPIVTLGGSSGLGVGKMVDGQWHHICLTFDNSTTSTIAYEDGISVISNTTTGGTLNPTATNLWISSGGATLYNSGSISNVSVWNTALTSAQITEIYNQGLPSNLNSHSAYSNLVSWWQLGENSSFAGGWICADEKGTNNGASTGMDVGALVNGVGTTANGVSTGMSEGNLVGDAPYSTTNALSTNMAVTARVTGSGNTP